MSQETDCSNKTSCAARESAGTCDSATQQLHMQSQLSRRVSLIKHRIVVLSGKEGVGRTTVAVNLAVAVAFQSLAEKIDNAVELKRAERSAARNDHSISDHKTIHVSPA